MAKDWEGRAAVGNAPHRYVLARFELFRMLFPFQLMRCSERSHCNSTL